MEYKCKLEKIDKISSNDHLDISLCSKCHSFDCSNPIENVSISFFGIQKEIRAFITPNCIYGVKQCEGFSSRSKLDSEEENDED